MVSGDNQAFWFRYTLVDGVLRQAATWGVLFEGDAVITGRDTHPLEALSLDGGPTIGAARLDAEGATGSAGPLSWALRFQPGDGEVLIPPAISRLGRTYLPARIDLRCQGHVSVDGRRIPIRDGRGVLGHIFGQRHTVADWAWGHCGGFDGAEDAVLEGISAQLDSRLPVPRLSAFVLRLGERVYRFSSPAALLRSRSWIDGDTWRFSARSGGCRLTGEATLGRGIAALTYDGADGRPTACRNAARSTWRILLEAPGVHRELSGIGPLELCNRVGLG